MAVRQSLIRMNVWLILAVLVLSALTRGGAAAQRLPALGAEAQAVTVSGISSGGAIAVQFHVAYSGIVRGAGAIASPPYGCAMGNLWNALANCTTPSVWAPPPSGDFLAGIALALGRAGAIDPPNGLANARVWLFSGTHDRTVAPEVVRALRDFYRRLSPGGDVVLVADVPAGHAMVTDRAGNACESSDPPYINNCGYDAAGALLGHLLGRLSPPAEPRGRLVEFDQREFAGGTARAVSLADSGYAWVPAGCERERCRVHVAFHGCRQGAEFVGERFVLESGYNRWAGSNRIVVLYPQAIARWGWSWAGGPNFIFNPRGCWDWWGYTGPEYHTRQAPQMRAVRAMLDRLGAPRQGSSE
jgi:poly(3-hydroxybutyrate) depolymerase